MTASAIYPPQLLRLARLLDIPAERLAGLRDVPETDLRQVQEQISEVLFSANRDNFARTAALSRAIPGALAGKLGERYLAPTLAARVAELLDPQRAKDLVNHVSVPYLADIAIALDPARSAPVIAHIPPPRVGEVAAELFRRDELAAMAEFAGSVPKAAISAAFAVATPSQLLRVSPYLIWNDNINLVIDEIEEAELDEIIRTAREEALWREAALLFRQVKPETLRRVAQRVGVNPSLAQGIPDELVANLATSLIDQGDRITLVAFADVVPPEPLQAALRVLDPAVLLQVLPLIEWTDTIRSIVTDLTDQQLTDFLTTAREHNLWNSLLGLANEIEPDTLQRLATVVAAHPDLAAAAPPELIADLAQRLVALDDPHIVRAFIDVLTPEIVQIALNAVNNASLLRILPLIHWTDTIRSIVTDLTDQQLTDFLTTAREHNLWNSLLGLANEIEPDTLQRLATVVAAHPDLAAAAPPELIADLAQRLVALDDPHIVRAFIDVLTPEIVQIALNAVNNASLLRILPLIHWTDTIRSIVTDLTDQQLTDFLTTAREHNLWNSLLGLANEIEPDTLQRLATVVAAHPDLAAAAPPELIADLAQRLVALDDPHIVRAFIDVLTPEIVQIALNAVNNASLLRILPLIHWTDTIRGIVTDLTDQQLTDFLTTAREHNLWASLRAVADKVEPPMLRRISAIVDRAPELAEGAPADLVALLSTGGAVRVE